MLMHPSWSPLLLQPQDGTQVFFGRVVLEFLPAGLVECPADAKNSAASSLRRNMKMPPSPFKAEALLGRIEWDV